MCKEVKGLVYNLERFAVHDGPGIRTLVHMKGCPLRCVWCSSPQSHKKAPEVLHLELHCKKCGLCARTCPVEAIVFNEEDGPRIARELCDSCGQCVETCPSQAMELVGESVTVEELYREVAKDSPFYRRSKGGVTVGGGELTMQREFVTEFLKKCKQHYIHTAIESCGHVKWEYLEQILEHVDLAYFDVKHMDAFVHRELTGVSNERILENVKRAAAMRPVIIRIPTVPGYNDSDENIEATARFAAGLGENLERIELLPYHKFGTQTYSRLGREYELESVEPPSDAHMERLKEIVEACGIAAQIGG